MFETYAPDFDVKIQGLTLGADVRRLVTSVTYDNHLDQADMFRIELADPGTKLIDSSLFATGKMVEIALGYSGKLHPMIMGEVAALEPSFPAGGVPSVAIIGYDRSQRMRHNRPSRPPFVEVNDSLIAAQIAAENRLIPLVDPSPRAPRSSVPQNSSDFALLQDLARRNGFEVFVRFDKLYFRFPRPQLQRVSLEWGRTLASFSPRLSTSGQARIQVIRGYNEELAQTIVSLLPAAAAGGFEGVVERIGSQFADALFELGRRTISDQQVDNPLDAAALARSLLEQLLEGLYEGSGSCIGNPDLRAGDQVEIIGVGKRFSGVYKLRQVTHTVSDQGYETRFEVAQRYTSTLLESLRDKLVEKPPPNHPPPVPGVAIARVENNVDPLGLGRVQLSYPFLSDVNLSGWARVAAFAAGGGANAYFLPGRGDEVLVAFLQGDLQKPVVLGSLWSAQRRPPETNFDGLNRIRTITTQAGHTLRFDDTAGAESVTVEAAGGGKIVIQAGGTVTVEAAGKLTLHGPSIQINADKDATISAGSIKLTTGPTTSLTMDGTNVKVVLPAAGTLDVR
jgi:phage protein D/phage baseplate assembly protein gpV